MSPMTSPAIVWDIETVPDLKGFAAANGHNGRGDDEVLYGPRSQDRKPLFFRPATSTKSSIVAPEPAAKASRCFLIGCATLRRTEKKRTA
jgi:hypothetical protein